MMVGLLLLAALASPAAAAPDPRPAPPATRAQADGRLAQGPINPLPPTPPRPPRPGGPSGAGPQRPATAPIIRENKSFPGEPEVPPMLEAAPLPIAPPEPEMEPSVQGAVPAPMRLTYREAVQLTLERSPELEEYRSRIREAEAGIDVARAPGLPQLGLEGIYTRSEPGQVLNFGGAQVNLQPNDNYNVGLTLRQTIATFGRLHWANLAAELTERAAREQYRAQLEGQIQQASNRYLLALLADEEVQIYRQQLKGREEFLRTAEILFKAGTVARFDVLRARSEVSQARQALLEAENAARSAEASLASLIGVDPGTELELVAVETGTEPPTDTREAMERALTRRPEIRALAWAVEASRARVELEGSQDNPNLALLSTATHRNAAGLAAQTEQWNTSVVLTVPFADGGLARARADQAREAVNQIEQRLVATRRSVALEVEQAFLDLRTRWERIQVAEENLAQAEEALRVAAIRYRAGLSISVELLDAETAFTRARQAVAGARYLYLAAGVAWNRATSEEYPVEVPGPLPESAPGGLVMPPVTTGAPVRLDSGGNSPDSPATEDPAVPVILPRSSE